MNCAHLDFLTPESDDMQYLEVRRWAGEVGVVRLWLKWWFYV